MPIGIDLRAYRELPDRSAARQALRLPVDRLIVLFVGAIVRTKGVVLLKEALELLGRSDTLGVFVGRGPMLAEIAAGAQTLCVGAIAPDLVRLYMRAADVLVLPSFSEGMPTVLVEAGAADLPVIATTVGGIKELLDDGRGLLVPPGSVDALAAAVHGVLSDPSSARARAGRLRDLVGREYDVDRNARTWMQIYEGLR
jgi:teichuronic acid biosynthesis glycosyltransferase TuaC